MVYAQAHYAPGFGERYVQSTPVTTLAEAQQRVRHYSMPILQLGGSYFATAYGDADEIVGRVLNQPNTSYGAIFAAGDGYSPSTLTDSAHEDDAAARVWVQQTTISGFHFGQPDFWYAFAGDPNRTPAGASVPIGGPEMQRLSGADRYATAAAVSAASFSPGVPVAYVATGANFPDALAAGAAAAERGGPVLLVTGSAIPASTAAELATTSARDDQAHRRRGSRLGWRAQRAARLRHQRRRRARLRRQPVRNRCCRQCEHLRARR